MPNNKAPSRLDFGKGSRSLILKQSQLGTHEGKSAESALALAKFRDQNHDERQLCQGCPNPSASWQASVGIR
jgi:hypothetical protein